MRYNHSQIHSTIKAIVLIVILGCFLLVMPVQAQSLQNSPITLDGRQLFKVSNTGQVSAENRATDANLILKQVWVKGLGEDYLDFQLLVWISKPRRQFQIRSDLYFQIDENFRHDNILIPFPQRSLHLNSGSLPLELSPKLEDSLLNISAILASLLNKQAQSDSFNGSNNSLLNHKKKDE